MTMKCPIEHAKSYPFDIPDGSFVLGKDGWREIRAAETDETVIENRHAVIASGSNASPTRLADKYVDHGHLLDDPIYATRAIMFDFDTVYSAHFSRYGSIPATLAHAPGAAADVFVTWLTDGQLERMHETESIGINYDFTQLFGIELTIRGKGHLDNAHAYLSRKGCLTKDGAPVPLAEINTEGRRWAPMSQEQVLDYTRSLIDPHADSDTFIKTGVTSPARRKQRTQALEQYALPHGWHSLIFKS